MILGAVLLWPLVLNPTGVAFHPNSEVSDLLISHWPNAAYIRDSLSRYGQLPLWNAQIMAGQPFAGDPLSGLWYPPNWLLLVLPLAPAFNLLFVLHVASAAYGMYRFLRSLGLDPGPAFFGGLVFAGTPKLMAHLGAGHVSLVFALAWTPWLLLAIRRAAAGGVRPAALAGACLALMILADLRWAYFAGLLGLAYWFSQVGWDSLKPSRWKDWAPGLAVFGLLAFMLSAVLTFPLYEFLTHSARSSLTLEEAGRYALPAVYLLGLLVPDPYGYHEWMTYLGLIPLLAALQQMVKNLPRIARITQIKRERSETYCRKPGPNPPAPFPAREGGEEPSTLPGFWVGVILLAAAFSLGTGFFVYPLLFRILPGLSFIRVPPRAWFLVAFGVGVLAALALQELAGQIRARTQAGPMWALRYGASAFVVAIILFTAADLLRVNASLLESRPVLEQTPAAAWIAEQPGLFRVYSPSYSLPFPDGMQHAEGIDPLHLAAFSEYMARAAGLPVEEYSVTVPSFMDENGTIVDSLPSAELLGLLNVRYVASAFQLASPGFELDRTFGSTYVYENEAVRPRVWVEGAGEAQLTRWSPNRIEVDAAGPGRLVLSEVAYPGWVVRVDGERRPVETVYSLLRGVQLPEDVHTVVFEYRPGSLYAGAALSLLGLALLLGILRWAK